MNILKLEDKDEKYLQRIILGTSRFFDSIQ